MKTWIQPVSLLRNDEQKIVTNGYPYLRVHGILGSAVESLDVKMLLDPFEEQFYLPAFTVEFRNKSFFSLASASVDRGIALIPER